MASWQEDPRNHRPNEVIDPKITRIDLYANPDGLFIRKYAEGWTASTPSYERYTNPNWTLDSAVAWLKEQGWTVRQWNGGARAWLGEKLPVRDRQGIVTMRKRLESFNPFGHDVQLHTLDLRYDL